MAPQEREQKIIMQNRKARHEYQVVETIEAGIALVGTEVKALREGKCNFQDCYAVFEGKENPELWLTGLHISPFSHGNINNHIPNRKRKLLLRRRELEKLRRRVEEKGLTLVPLSLYFSGPFVKVELGVVRGKKMYDKRQDSKERDIERSMRRGDDD